MIKPCAFSVILLVALLQVAGSCLVHSQESTASSIKTWLDAARLLDSQSVDEAKRGEAWLRQALANKETPVEAAWTLALFCVKRNDFDALDRVVKAIGQRYPNPPLAVAFAVERMKLSIALFHNDATTAEIAMKKITNAVSSEQIPKADRQLGAASLGAIVGMLESEAADPPIAKEILDRVKQTLTALKQDDISPQFTIAYESARTKAAALTGKLEAITESGIAPVKAEQQKLINELEALSKSIEDAEEELRLTKLNADEQTKANRISIKQLQAFVRKLEQNWKISTPGHPGPERPKPLKPTLPSRDSIHVDEYEYETETVTERDANGNSVQRTYRKRVRRSAAEIERERDREYEAAKRRHEEAMRVYVIKKAAYDEYLIKYRSALAAWIQTDRDRREKMKQQKESSLQKVADLEKQINSMEEERVAAVEKVLALRPQRALLQAEVETLGEALRATENQNPISSFRPGFFETVFVDSEKGRLMKTYGESVR